jgi:hypothetical protein
MENDAENKNSLSEMSVLVEMQFRTLKNYEGGGSPLHSDDQLLISRITGRVPYWDSTLSG